MVAAKLLEPGPPRLFVVAVDTEEEVTEALVAFAEEHGITAAAVTAFGGFRSAMLGFFDLDQEEYVRNPVDQQTEVLSLVGDIGRDDDGTLALHAHVVLGLRDGTTRGGHLLGATVRPTLEVMVTESHTELRRRYRPDLGLTLLDLDG
jgi:uncharacterized protein